MTRRERVRAALRFEAVDQVPKDLGAMASTGVSCFAYPALVAALGLPYRPPKVFDTGQMLALPDTDVLDALDCDCVMVNGSAYTNAFDEPERWHAYDFGRRLEALVHAPESFAVLPDGTVQQGNRAMVPASYVFDAPHGGQPFDVGATPGKENLESLRESLAQRVIDDTAVATMADYCRRARESTDRAIMFTGLNAGLGFRGGIAAFSMQCLLDPGYVADLHDVVSAHAVAQVERLLPAIAPYVDVLMLAADDQGTQQASILPPPVFEHLYVPYYGRVTDACRRVAPEVFTFLHSCGAIYDLLDGVHDAGFQALNPVQWNAGGHSYAEWKARCRNRLCLWGGGVDTQGTLPLGTVSDVRAQVGDVVSVLSQDSGYIFCAIHNLLAEVAPEKIIAMYETAAQTAGL